MEDENKPVPDWEAERPPPWTVSYLVQLPFAVVVELVILFFATGASLSLDSADKKVLALVGTGLGAIAVGTLLVRKPRFQGYGFGVFLGLGFALLLFGPCALHELHNPRP